MKKRGFTLVEIIVAMMIFSIVAVVALAALVKIIDANKKAQTTHDAVTNLSFVLEAMSREMRSGSNYYCNTQIGGGSPINLWSDTSGLRYALVNNCASGFGPNQSSAQAIIIAFTSPNTITAGAGSPCKPTYAYRLRRPNSSATNWILEKSEQAGCVITQSASSRLNVTYDQSAGDTFLPIISSNNTSLNSYYVRMLNGDFPYFFLALSGYAGVKEQSKSYFTVQTASSPRVP
ncbi:MAG: type II secretion system protein [Candidatus Paceibacterota bacterium]